MLLENHSAFTGSQHSILAVCLFLCLFICDVDLLSFVGHFVDVLQEGLLDKEAKSIEYRPPMGEIRSWILGRVKPVT